MTRGSPAAFDQQKAEAIRGLDEPGVVVELRRQASSEGDVGLDWLRDAIRSALRLDRRLHSVQRIEIGIRTGTEADPTHVDVGGVHQLSLG